MMKLANEWIVNDEGRLVRPNGSICDPGEVITAAEICEALRIPTHETMFHNHSGVVPAAHVVREALENGVRRGRPPVTDRPTLSERFLLSVTKAQKAKIKARGGAKWLRGLIDKGE